MARSARATAGYDFLDRHIEVIKRLLPTARGVAFFDARGRPLRVHGPVPLSQVRLQVRSVLKSTAIGSGRRPVDAILPVSASERAAAFVLYAGSASGGPDRTPTPVAGACLVVFHIVAGEDCPPLDTLQAQLEPALACVGDHLARYADESTRGPPADEAARDLEWLFEVTAPAPQRHASQVLPDRGERLTHLVTGAMAYLQCVLGALVVPERHLRIVRTAGTAQDTEAALRQLEPPVLSCVQRKNQPIVINRTTTWSRGATARGTPSAVRLLAVPVNGHASEPAGALMLLRSEDAPEFTATHLPLIKLLGRYVASLLESDFDALTGLHTRASAQAQVHSWDEAPHPPGPHSVIFFDINRLGIVNDTKGFDAGDALIVRVAQLLAEPYLPPDAVAARISSDKFAVALPHVDAEAAAETARTLQQAAAQLPSAAAEGDEPVSLSCGIACFTEPHEFPGALALAQLAYRTARDHGRGRVEIYQDDDDSMIRRRSDSIAVIRLREALHNDHFTLFAQRLMPLQGRGDPEGYELLLRSLQSPHKNRAPADLLSAAHRSQLAPALDLWVMEHALAEAAPHRSALRATDTSLSINITGPSLTDATFLQQVERLIRESRIAPSLVTFEITETIAVLSLSKALEFIRELRAMGCRFALDDFGTGTNSLKNLTNLPVDRVKIDGSFVTDILCNPQSVAMVRAIVSLTRDLGIGTVAEYAENVRIIERLRELGVQYAQGYGVEKPRAFKEVLNELSARESRESRVLGREI